MDVVLLDLALDMPWGGMQKDTGGPTMAAGGHTGGIEKVIYSHECHLRK